MKRKILPVVFTIAALCALAADDPKKPAKPPKPVMPGGMVSHYPFDTTDTGGWTPCSVDTNFNSRVFNARWAQAWNKSGYELNGVNGRIVIADHKRLNSPCFTLSMHFKTYKVREEKRTFLNKGLDQGYMLSILGSDDEQGRNLGKLCFEIQGKRCLSDRSLADGAWYNVTVTVDHKVARMFIDGKKQKDEAILKKHFTPVTDDLIVGVDEKQPEVKGKKKSKGFEGEVDELMIFNRTLSEKEVSDLFYCSIPHYNKKSVQWRIRDLDDLLERNLITKDFHARKMKELDVE